MRRILIVGAGYVGCALGARLAARGDEVFALRRRVLLVPPPLSPVTADVTRPETLSGLPDRLDSVVFTIAPDATTDEAYAHTYVDGTRHLLAALAEQGGEPPRILFTSSTSVYGQGDGEWIDETSPAEPTSFSGRRLLEAEALLGASGRPVVVLRLGAIYGPGREGLVQRVREGSATYPRAGPCYGNRNHKDDCAAALEHLIALGTPAPLYLGVDHEPADLRVVLEWLAARLGVSMPQAADEASSPRRASSKRASNRLLVESGFRFRYPTFREGYASFVAAGSSTG
ncbi:MAG: NAD-dependent epimerase/dehydratase family protein [Polyangiaceae bacterium]|nr:NAD-dependent epimerase/dehydratase family protein [Polyangiaceae bacterium]